MGPNLKVANSAAVAVLSTNAMSGVLPGLVRRFERASGAKVSVSHAPTKEALRRIRNGEALDLVILTRAGIDELVAERRVVAGTCVDLGRAGLGVGVRAGSKKPDIGSVDAFRRAILDARCVAYSTAGASGLHFAAVLKRLGIDSQLKNRVVTGGLIGNVLLRGEADLGIQMVSELLAVPGIELVGPFPAELQNVLLFSAGTLAGCTQPESAQALGRFLASPEAARAMKAGGLGPVR